MIRAQRAVRRLYLGLAGVALTALAAGLVPVGAAHAASPRTAASAKPTTRDVCGPARRGFARCLSIVRTDVRPHAGLFATGAAPAGYSPASLQAAYRFPSLSAGSGRTVAIVDAYDDPNAEADLAVYRRQYGLAPCTTANRCFRKIAQDGTTNYPAPDSGWAMEISLDLDMVSAICPKCHILLVEANTSAVTDLGSAVDEAVALGAKYVSNSYGASESQLSAPVESDADTRYYNHPGVVLTAASGDQSYAGGVSYPAASPYVTAIGGTTLTQSPGSPRGWGETAWSGSGSGCSAFEPKPAWQRDVGCGHRTVADMAAVADPNTGVAAYDTYLVPTLFTPLGWQVIGGTSAAAPIIASAYALASAPSPVANPASYPYADPTALNDVTSGNTGTCKPAYLCTAGPGYDGPTGLGTPDGLAALSYGVHGAHGTITGTVTASATGKPLQGAEVSTGGYTAITDATGRYRLDAVPGSRDVSVSAFGYATTTIPGVQITVGQSVTENAGLSAVPFETVSGTVTDGSGHGWPLAARITLPGTPVVAYDNPLTGRYSIRLPAGGTYAVQVDPVYPGYQRLSTSVNVPNGSVVRNLTPQIAGGAGCNAPGYGTASVFSETFDKATIPPGWSTTSFPDNSPGITWRFDRPDGVPNGTGGTGNYAFGFRPQTNFGTADTALVTPVINMSHVAFPTLGFDEYDNYSATVGSVELSTDGGSTWAKIWDNSSAFPIPQQVSVALPQAAGKPSVRLRFRMFIPAGNAEIYTGWQVDNVTVTNCGPTSGGLLVGQVRDANTGQGIDGATISGDSAAQVTNSAAIPGDPWLGHGSYWLFTSPAGSHSLTVADRGYATLTGTATTTANRVTPASFTLKAGRLSVAPAAVTASQTLGGHSTVTVTVKNTGSAPDTVNLDVRASGYATPGQAATVRIAGRFGPGPSSAPGIRPATAAYSDSTPWAPVASLPQALWGSAAATDPATGRVYVAGGNGTYQPVADVWMLNPHTSAWAAQPPMHHTRFGGQAAFIGGKLYVTGGWDALNNPVPQVEIYDPASRTWTTGASIPQGYYGAATAVLNGKMYVIGGCYYVNCGGRTDVQVYNPATDRWTIAAPYPVAVGELGCGAIAGKIYCAGGLGNYLDYSNTPSAFVYDPAGNAWHPIASLPADLWGSTYTVADGQLLLSGGITANNSVLTNQGYAYDPATNTWSSLPNAPLPTYEAAGACGTYRIGGNADAAGRGESLPWGWAAPVPAVAQLPGYGDCGGHDWVSAQPKTVTLAPGQSATITVTLASTAPAVTQPGTYTAMIRLGGSTPYPAPTVPVTLTVKPPAGWGEITGTVYGKSCAGGTAPVPGASVQIDGLHGTWPLTADYAGRFELWLDAANNPLTVVASQTGWHSQVASVKLKAGGVTADPITLTALGC